MTCYRKNCLHWKNATFGTRMRGRQRDAALTPCRHCLCHCHYVICHLVASMHGFIAHYCSVLLSGHHHCIPTRRGYLLPAAISSDGVAFGCCVALVVCTKCCTPCTPGMVMTLVNIVMPLVHLDAVIRVLPWLLLFWAALWRYFGIAAHWDG